MKATEIVVGGLYRAKVSNRITTVRVDNIGKRESFGSRRGGTVYSVTNIETGRKTAFYSATKFRSLASEPVVIGSKPPYPGLNPVADLDREYDQIAATYDTKADTYELDEDGNEIEVPFIDPHRVITVAEVRSVKGYNSQGNNPQNISKEAVVMQPVLTRNLQTLADQPPHIMVEARAGSGKTFTIVAGVVYTFRNRCPGLWGRLVNQMGFNPVPSIQQHAVWETMEKSSDARYVQLTAFNKSIVREFEEKWGWVISELGKVGVRFQFSTNHSMGFSAVRKKFPRLNVDEDRVVKLIAQECGRDLGWMRRQKWDVLRGTNRLVDLCKMNMIDIAKENDPAGILDDLVAYHDLDLEGNRDEIFALVPKIMERCADPVTDGSLDYSDMIWLPCYLDLPVFQNDLLMVDEFQDLNRCQQMLAKKAGRRIIGVGDPRQAIYGFAGADAESMPRMVRELSDTARRCSVLPLTVTRRCGKAIVREANKIVEDFHAHDSNPEGVISYDKYPTYVKDGSTIERAWDDCYLSNVKPGDFVLCRVNAPLVSNCFRFIKKGIKANIQGRDIAQGLISTIEKLNANTVTQLSIKVAEWLMKETTKEMAKALPSDSRIIALQDRADCLMCFIENNDSVDGVIRSIRNLFSDERQGSGIRMSSIHKAKGLESKRVFLLMPRNAPIPHPLAKSAHQREQEYNLKYVAITRAIEEFVYVEE